jgi:hypothetical protein
MENDVLGTEVLDSDIADINPVTGDVIPEGEISDSDIEQAYEHYAYMDQVANHIVL